MDVTVPAEFYLTSLGGPAVLFGWVTAVQAWRRRGRRAAGGPGRSGTVAPWIGLAIVGVAFAGWYALPSALPGDLGLYVTDAYFRLAILLTAVALAILSPSSRRSGDMRPGDGAGPTDLPGAASVPP